MKILIAIAISGLVLLACVFAGPISSGAILLLLHDNRPSVEHDLPREYTALHKGHVDLETGLYIREDEDLIVRGTPPLIVRRAYLSNYRVSKQFGVGATHDGEWYLVGDGDQFTWASLILATGTHVQFRRVSPGRSYHNALYASHEDSGEWSNARLGWTGFRWTLRLADGSTGSFRPCGAGSVCSLLAWRDSDGHMIQYRRNLTGRLTKIDTADDRWILFEYDDRDRISRAYSASAEVRYKYDPRDRLTQVASSDGVIRRYTYTDLDQMATVEEPDISIENTYDQNGRCIRQVDHFADDPEPLTFQFDYTLQGDRVAASSSTRSDGTWSRYTFDDNRRPLSETWGGDSQETATISYERDPGTGSSTAVTVTCPDRTGRPLHHTSVIRDGNEEWIKWDLLHTHCSWQHAPQTLR